MRKFSVAVVLALVMSATPAAAQATGSISGTVTDDAATAIDGVQICAFRDADGIGACGVSAMDGTYTISGLPAASDYRVNFSDGNVFVGEFYDDTLDFSQATLVDVPAGQNVSGIDASLQLGGSISGTVTDSNSNPLAGIQVCANAVNGLTGDCGTTIGDGTYTVKLLAGGVDHLVQFIDGASVYGEQFYDGAVGADLATAVMVTSGQVTPNIDASLELAGSISGTVTDGAAALMDIQVCAFSAAGNGSCGFTAADGTYVVPGLSAGSDYRVQFFDNNGLYVSEYYDNTNDFNLATLLTVSAGQDSGGIDAVLNLAGTISGTVTDNGANPVAGITVCASSNTLFTGGCSATMSDGTYTVGGLGAAPDYRVRFSDDGGQFVPETHDVAVAIGQNIVGIDASLEAAGFLSGTVTGDAANALSGIYVCANSIPGPGVGGCATTASDGFYTIGGLSPTFDYRVDFFDLQGQYTTESYDSTTFFQATPVSVVVGQTTTGIDASLELGGSISGTVTDANANPLSGISVCVDSQALLSGNCSDTLIDGTYMIPGLGAATDYSVTFFDINGLYESEYFDDTNIFNQATLVAVTSGQMTTAIDATLDDSVTECAGKAITVNLNLGQLPTTGPDVILGTPGPDFINGLAGDDTICGMGGADIINGGGGIDEIFGGEGDDTIGGQGGDDVLFGEGGNDRLNGGVGADRMFGGLGDDDLRGQGDDDMMYGNEGVDQFFGGSGDDYIDAGLDGNRGTGKVVRGGGNNDTIYGSPGDDDLEGISGLDEIHGLEGNDRLRGGNALDRLWGGAGDDLLEGGAQRDFLYGGDDDDDLRGGNGNDDLFGESGDDALNGQGDTDLCDGGLDVGDTATASCETILGVP